ncbi:AAA family ATPase [bacterium]|nr:AAA family ATPase [candidate division CSSED10-310 bacterium]
MLIKSLKMKNFRQFKGETRIPFSCDPEKNVTIILGNNTFGKTTLLQAFSWCFYQTVTFDKNPDFLLNLEIETEMNNDTSSEVEVEITLIHDNTEYVMTRTQVYTCKNGTVRGLSPSMKVSYKQPDGQTESVRAVQVANVINNILPEDLSSYFFFDTERVRSISTRHDVADAVKSLLGLSAMDNAIKHLGLKTTKSSVIGKFYGSMDLDGDAKAKEAIIRIQDAQAKREAIASQLDTCASEINHYEGRKEQLDTILRNNQTTTALQKKKETLERQIKAELTAQESLISTYLKEFNYGSLQFYAQPLLQRALDFLKEAKIDDKGIKDLTAITIMDVIKSGKCICGAEIVEGNKVYDHLMHLIAFVPPESIGNAVRNYREKLSSFGSSSDRIYDSLKSRFEDIFRSKSRVQEWNEELEDVSTQIKGKENMRQYELELVDVKARLREFQAKKERLIRDDEGCKQNIETYQKIYDSLVAVSGKNKTAMQYIMYAESIRDWLDEAYRDKEDLIREKLETKVNAIFERMYHGHRRVVIDRKYQVTLLSSLADKEVDTGESEGSNRVKNFAFIAGLVALAKEKIISDSGEEGLNLTSEPYPLVMDAPFSNADEIHTGNISRVLPEVAEQVIMFVMQKDWRYAEPLMNSRVGLRYALDKHSETYSGIKGV